jgi:hypothetical protein
MSFLIFDNRGVGIAFGFGNTGQVDFEIEAGMSSYLAYGSRSIFRLFGVHREALRSQRWGLFVAQSPDSVHLTIWNNLKIKDLSELLVSRYSLPHGHDSWTGFLASALQIVKFRKADLLSTNTNRISLRFITNEIALFGAAGSREQQHQQQRSLESVAAFSLLLNELRRSTGIRIDCSIICFKICKSRSASATFHSLVCQSNSLLFKSSLKENGSTEIISTDNSPLHFEAVVRRILRTCKSTIMATLTLPKTENFRCSLDLELTPCTMDAMVSLHDGLRELKAVSLIPQAGMNPISFEGKALLVRPREHEDISR